MSTPSPAHAATILVVEDQQELRAVIREILEEAGYAVLDVSGPEEALALARTHPVPIRLLMTDVVLPRMTGPDLAARLVGLLSGIKILYMSGDIGKIVGTGSPLRPGDAIIEKPFPMDALLRKVRDMLEGERPSD